MILDILDGFLILWKLLIAIGANSKITKKISIRIWINKFR
jgi:hypothetical protein